MMIKHGFFVACLLLSLFVGRSEGQLKQTILLWPNGAPGALGEAEKDKPKLHISIPEKQNGTAIVILPGGGYGHLAMGHEGKEISEWFNRLGIATFICEYRHRGKGYRHPAPMQDAHRAIQWVRANSKKWKIDPNKVGVIGFSAGGHLASTVSNHNAAPSKKDDSFSKQRSRPDFAILCYPVIALGEPYTHVGSQRNLLGKSPSAKLLKQFSNEKQVSQKTPPTFLWSTADDRAVKVENSLQYFRALRKNNISAEIHVYPTGRHGLGMAKGNASVSNWTTACEQWLLNQGFASKNTRSNDQELFFVFLTTGKSTAGVDKSEILKMQKAHLQNFGKLAKAGKLLSAGPLADPNKKLRGIVLLQAKNENAIAGMFRDDPYVMQDFMRLEVHPAKQIAGSIQNKPSSAGMDEYRIVISEQDSQYTPSNAQTIRRLKSRGELLFAMSLATDKQIAIFKKLSDKRMKQVANQLNGGKSLQIMPLYMGKGIFD